VNWYLYLIQQYFGNSFKNKIRWLNPLNIVTVESWDEALWNRAKPVYEDAFGGKGAKPEKIIRNMFKKNIAQLHMLFENTEVVAMAISGHVREGSPLIIDYLAVSNKFQKQGYGKSLVNYIIKWSGTEKIFIEVECEETVENLTRIRFWENCGFVLTEYVHQYVWVPEPYKGMYLLLKGEDFTVKGEDIFKEIVEFHRLSFRR
jgi:GNAT superfamily N-acetyltransferase